MSTLSLDSKMDYSTLLQQAFHTLYELGKDEWSDDRSLDLANDFAAERLIVQQKSKIAAIPMRVLDIGCGTGRHALQFSKRDMTYFGIDICANSNWQQLSLMPGIEFCKMNFLQAEDLSDFDLIIDNGCFHHQAAEALDTYIHKVSSSLSDRGLYSVVVWNEPFRGVTTDELGRQHRHFDLQSLACRLRSVEMEVAAHEFRTAKNGTQQLQAVFTKT